MMVDKNMNMMYTNEDLDTMAINLMSKFPHLEQMSLDEWVLEHHDVLTKETRDEARAIIDLYN